MVPQPETSELSLVKTHLMSLTVFSAATQMSAVALVGAGMPAAIIIGTAIVLNIQLILIGLSIGRQTKPHWLARLVGAYFLTDGAYGTALGGGILTFPRLLGAGISMFIAWNLGTALGATAVHTLPALDVFAADFVVPLTFFAILIPLIQTRASALTVLPTGLVTLGLIQLLPSGIAVLTAILVGAITGAWWRSE